MSFAEGFRMGVQQYGQQQERERQKKIDDERQEDRRLAAQERAYQTSQRAAVDASMADFNDMATTGMATRTNTTGMSDASASMISRDYGGQDGVDKFVSMTNAESARLGAGARGITGKGNFTQAEADQLDYNKLLTRMAAAQKNPAALASLVAQRPQLETDRYVSENTADARKTLEQYQLSRTAAGQAAGPPQTSDVMDKTIGYINKNHKELTVGPMNPDGSRTYSYVGVDGRAAFDKLSPTDQVKMILAMRLNDKKPKQAEAMFASIDEKLGAALKTHNEQTKESAGDSAGAFKRGLDVRAADAATTTANAAGRNAETHAASAASTAIESAARVGLLKAQTAVVADKPKPPHVMKVEAEARIADLKNQLAAVTTGEAKFENGESPETAAKAITFALKKAQAELHALTAKPAREVSVKELEEIRQGNQDMVLMKPDGTPVMKDKKPQLLRSLPHAAQVEYVRRMYEGGDQTSLSGNGVTFDDKALEAIKRQLEADKAAKGKTPTPTPAGPTAQSTVRGSGLQAQSVAPNRISRPAAPVAPAAPVGPAPVLHVAPEYTPSNALGGLTGRKRFDTVATQQGRIDTLLLELKKYQAAGNKAAVDGLLREIKLVSSGK